MFPRGRGHTASKYRGVVGTPKTKRSRLTPHGLWRTLNTLALEVTPSEAVRKVLGHAGAAMTERYLAPSMHGKRAVLGKVVTLVRGADVGIVGGDRGAR